MKRLKFLLLLPVVLTLLAITTSCGDVDVDDNDEAPYSISYTVEMYFGGYAWGCTDLEDGTYRIKISGGPEFVLKAVDNDPIGRVYAALISYTGNGSAMPQNMASDYLDDYPTLLQYIEEIGSLDEIFSWTIQGNVLTLGLLDSTVEYNTRTGKYEQYFS